MRKHAKRMGFVFRYRRLIITGLLLAVAAFYLHKPVPEEITERPKLIFFLPFTRLVYYYPSRAFSYIGLRWHVTFTRACLKYFSYLFGLGDFLDGGLKEYWNTNFANVPARVYIPENRSNDGAIFFIHGGGFVLLDVDSYDHVMRELVRKTRMTTVSIEYRLAPEHVFPAALEDCEKALTAFLIDHYRNYDVDPNKVVIMGDSAGGNLAAIVALRMRDKMNLPQLKLQVLIYPVIQFVDLMTPSYQFAQQVTDGSALADTESLARYYLVYFGLDTSHMASLLKNKHVSPRSYHHFKHVSHDILPSKFKRENFYSAPKTNTECDLELYRQLEPFLFNPDASPIMSPSLAGLPKSLVITCEFDPLRDEGYWYMDRMKKEGVNTTWIHYENAFHAIMNFYTVFPLGRKAYDDVAKFILSHIDS